MANKAPAFQMYPGDILRSADLRKCSWQTRGIWWDMLALMWFEKEQGILRGTIPEICRAIGCIKGELTKFIAENERHKFADVTIRNGDVTIKNRRMHREWLQHKNDAKRQLRHRIRHGTGCENNSNTTNNADRNASVTPSSRLRNASRARVSPTPTPTPTPKTNKNKNKNKKNKNKKNEDEKGLKDELDLKRNPQDILGLGLPKNPQDILGLDLKIAESRRFFTEQVAVILKPTVKEAKTFANIAAHLVQRCQKREADVSIFSDAVSWARDCATEKRAGRVRSAKAVFVAKVKRETGFAKQKKILQQNLKGQEKMEISKTPRGP